jgi:hypothetical protein
MKARSITSKAASACKINMGLVNGARAVHDSKGFKNHTKLQEKGESPKKTVAAVTPEPTNTDETPKNTLGEKKVNLGKGLGSVSTVGVKSLSNYDTELIQN